MKNVKTYDVVFHKDEMSTNKGWKQTLEYCKEYIRCYNGLPYSYFKEYKGGIVTIVCNETRRKVFEEEVF
jgi:hypothetical protein